MGIHLMIFSDEVFNSSRNLLTRAHWRCICGLGGLFWVNLKRWVVRKVGWAVQNQQLRLMQMIRWDGHWEQGSSRAGMILKFSMEWESHEHRGGSNIICVEVDK